MPNKKFNNFKMISICRFYTHIENRDNRVMMLCNLCAAIPGELKLATVGCDVSQ